ncbi:MAG: DNA gyrase C-terminal beta-propeller domain-containing protein, partial [Clostridiaceae bacterium]
LNEILSSEEKLLEVIKEELLEIKEKYGDERRTQIEKQENEIDIEDLIQEEEVVITLTHSGYVKRIAADTYSSQRRGGKGIQAMTTKEDDFVEHVVVTSTHSDVLFFTNKGRVFKLRAYEIPDAGRTAKGTNVVNLMPIGQDERIETVLSVKDVNPDGFLFMATKNGLVKKTPIHEFKNLRKNGLIAINLRDGDELLKVKQTYGDAEIIIATQNGYAIKFSEKDVRPMGRTASGVKSISLRKDDIAVCMDIATQHEDLLVISENGFGKRTPLTEYKLQNRGGMGLITYKVAEKTGKLVGASVCKEDDEMMLINTSGVAIRINVSGISVTSRSAMGVTLMRTNEEEKIAAIAKISSAVGNEEKDIPDKNAVSEDIDDTSSENLSIATDIES